jgi:hypothetical protein
LAYFGSLALPFHFLWNKQEPVARAKEFKLGYGFVWLDSLNSCYGSLIKPILLALGSKWTYGSFCNGSIWLLNWAWLNSFLALGSLWLLF